MRIYDLNCSGGTEGSELIAIGRRAWASHGEGSWTAAKISPDVIAELNDEQTTDLKQLFDAAEDIEEVSADTAVEERAAGGQAVSEFSFEATATETYEHIGQDLHIRPPTPSEVQGSVQQIDSKDELEALIGDVAP